jgi:hypothetical protein
LLRRAPLEEAKTSPSLAHGPPQGLSSTTLNTRDPIRQVDQPLASEPSGAEAWYRQIGSWFWETFASSASPQKTSIGTSIWLHHAISVADPLPVLRQALRALAVTHYGRVRELADLFNHGRGLYGQALRSLQQALNDHHLVWNDETLASVRALVLYEVGAPWTCWRLRLTRFQVFEPTSNDPTAWFGHLNGVTILLQTRGPERHTSTIARSVLEDVRYALVCPRAMDELRHWLNWNSC